MSQQKDSSFGTTLQQLLEKGNRNHFTVIRKGRRPFSLSITAFLLLLLLFCPAMLVILVLGLFLGWQYQFNGPDFPEDNPLNRFFSQLSEGTDQSK